MTDNKIIKDLILEKDILEGKITDKKKELNKIKSESINSTVTIFPIIDYRLKLLDDLIARMNYCINQLRAYNALDEFYYKTMRFPKCFSISQAAIINETKDDSICKDFGVDSSEILKYFKPKFKEGSYTTIGCGDEGAKLACKVPYYQKIIQNYNDFFVTKQNVELYLNDVSKLLLAVGDVKNLAISLSFQTDKYLNEIDVLAEQIPKNISSSDYITMHIDPAFISAIKKLAKNNMDYQVDCFAGAAAFIGNRCFPDYIKACNTISVVMRNQLDYYKKVIEKLIQYDNVNKQIPPVLDAINKWENWKDYGRYRYESTGCKVWDKVAGKGPEFCIDEWAGCDGTNYNDSANCKSTLNDVLSNTDRTNDYANFRNKIGPHQGSCLSGQGKYGCYFRERKPYYENLKTQLKDLQDKKAAIAKEVAELGNSLVDVPELSVGCCDSSVFCPGGKCNAIQRCEIDIDGKKLVNTQITRVDETFQYNSVKDPTEVRGQRDDNGNIPFLCWNEENAKDPNACMGGFILKDDGGCYAPDDNTINADCSPYSWDDFSTKTTLQLNKYADSCKYNNSPTCPSFNKVIAAANKNYDDDIQNIQPPVTPGTQSYDVSASNFYFEDDTQSEPIPSVLVNPETSKIIATSTKTTGKITKTTTEQKIIPKTVTLQKENVVETPKETTQKEITKTNESSGYNIILIATVLILTFCFFISCIYFLLK